MYCVIVRCEPHREKTGFLPVCENKGADQLRSNCEADQRLCFRYTDSAIFFLNFKLLVSFCDCTGRFLSDLVGNPEDRFSRVAAQCGIRTDTYHLSGNNDKDIGCLGSLKYKLYLFYFNYTESSLNLYTRS